MITLFLTLSLLSPAPVVAPDKLTSVFDRLYNFDFRGAHALLDREVAAHPEDPLPYAVRASAYLFYELDRLGILEGEFFSDDAHIKDKKKLRPDAATRAKLLQAIQEAHSRAEVILASHPDDRNALFAQCIASGIATDYMALVEKRQIRSLMVAKKSNDYAQRLLEIDPHFYDAYLSTGISEYLLGSLPFFIRWFVHFDQIEGSRQKGVENLKIVAAKGNYLRPFAKILLGICCLREKDPEGAAELLRQLARDYPENPLYRRELVKVSALISNSR